MDNQPPITQSETPLWSPDQPDSLQIITLNEKQVAAIAQIEKKLLKYRAHPHRTTWIKWALGIAGLILIFGPFLISRYEQLAIIGPLPFAFYWISIDSLAAESAYLGIARKNHWLYADGDQGMTSKLVAMYPMLFDRGNDNSQTLTDELWGKVPSSSGSSMPEYFWMSNFYYTTGSGKNATTHEVSAYAFPLPKPLEFQFSLSQPLYAAGGSADTKDDITTESVDFNQVYRIYYEGDREAAGLAIFKILTPDILEKILTLKVAKVAQIAFYDTTLLFLVPSPLPVPKKSDLLVSDPEAGTQFVTEVEVRLEKFLALAGSIVEKVSNN